MRILLCTVIVLFHSLLLAGQEDEAPEIRAWREFARQLETTGVQILSSYPQPTSLDRAEGLRYLLQQLGSSLQQKLVEQPDQIPLLRVGATTINKWGFDGADAKYQGAVISGGGSYRLHGRLGSARLFAMQLARMEGEYAAFGALTGDQLQADQAGNFEVLISPQRPSDWQGVWLELNPAADNLLVREYFSDWTTERPGRYYLERLDNTATGAAVTTEQMTALLNESARTFALRTPQWQGKIELAREHFVNKIHMQMAPGQGLASNAYGSGWFKVGDDEALVLELDAPDALLWSVQLGNVWWESIDYINHTASYNDSLAVASGDGKYRFVLAHEDPGVPNWLDPAGHAHGGILFRLQKIEKIVYPELKLVALADLGKHLPKNTPKVSVDQRRQEIAMRREHAAVRWAP